MKLIQRYDKRLVDLIATKHANLIEYKQVSNILFEGKLCKLLVLELSDINLYEIINSPSKPEYTSQSQWAQYGKHIALDIILGLEYMHMHDLVHKEVTSPNVLITLTNNPQKPFIAKLGPGDAPHPEAPLQTKTKPSKMSLIWSSPEPPKTPATDIYSYGVILWEIASREQPWKEKNEHDDLISEIKAGNFFTKHAQKCLDHCLHSLIERCTYLEPEKRLAAPLVKKEILELIQI